MSLSRVKLSLAEKLDIIPGVVSIVLAVFYALLTGLWRSERQANSLLLHVGYAVFRKATARLTPAQFQWMLPSTSKIYERAAKKAGAVPQTVELSHGGLGHWIGDRNAPNVLVWYHGGGFALPANAGYFKFFYQLIHHLERRGKRVSVFCLTYTLAPEATYPTQLKQAVGALRYILSPPNRDPSSVFIGGDSAGGNLVGAVLSHLAHPHPQIEPLTPTVHLGGAIFISPWTLLDTEFPDQEIYDGGDLITEAVAGPWAAGYLGLAPRDHYTDLSSAPTEWFADFPVNAVLITGGGNEILLPVIQDFAQKFQTGFPAAELFIGLRECHVAPIYNLELGSRAETAQGKKITEWLTELVH
ncbi:hypothetical protein N7492_007917 [Penicillium capsulatum]|uniref:Alpha/beta hydrolase fold-3 domain-containing protein n=1 Tax=Penicillium capsulatum TaxID=69766 RepID=A0A9W9I4X2_9EURO|nr:hypothetical protein N7492_007917 [Penicillium capsulatum]KAJ6117746.1 hypothetical protein N7512_007471 [Penicillium capsulatum]